MVVINSEITKLLSEEIQKIEIIRNNETSSLKEALADKIIIFIKEKAIVITPLINTDEINIEILNQSKIRKSNYKKNILSRFEGTKLNYTWTGINTNGYFDVFIMSTEDLKPTILILSEGSQLKILLISNPATLEA